MSACRRLTAAVLATLAAAATIAPARATAPAVGAPAQETAPAAGAPATDVVAVARLRYDALDDEGALALLAPLVDGPSAPPAAVELAARCLFQLRRFDDALARLGTLKTPSASATILLADCTAAKGDRSRALELLDRLLDRDPLQIEARVARIRVLIAQNELRAAGEAIADVRRMERDRSDLLPISALLAERRNQLPEAFRLYEMVLNTPWRRAALDPHVVSDAMEGAARVNFQGARFDLAVKRYEELVKRQPRRASYRFGLGMSQAMASLHDEAIATLREAVALDPANHECRMRLAELLKTTSKFEDAAREFELLRAVPAYRQDATRYLADVALRTGSIEKALEYVKEIEAADPPSAAVLETCGFVREEADDLPRAKADLRRCFELDPLRFTVLYRLARLLARSDSPAERAEGTALLERYKKAVPYLPALEKAIAAIQLMPDNPMQMVHLAGVLNVSGQYEPALRWITRALRVAPDDPLAHGIAGCIAANSGKNDEALAQFERAQALLGRGGDPKVQGYIEALRKGQPLPLPLGELREANSPGGGSAGDGK